MFVLSAPAASAERDPALRQAARSGDLVPTPLWASAGGSRFSEPRAFPVECLEWAGWCSDPQNRDPAQRAPDPPGSSLQPLCTFLETAGLRFLRAPSPALLAANKRRSRLSLSP